MSHTSIQPLKSASLAGYAVQFPCRLCGEGNVYDADRCRRCFAPMVIGELAADAKKRSTTHLIPTLGTAGTGKTSFLGMALELLGRRSGKDFRIRAKSNSLTLQQQTMSALARCQFPSRTPLDPENWNWAHAEVQMTSGRPSLDMFFPDLPGEAILHEVERVRNDKSVSGVLSNASGYLVLVDAECVERGDKDEEFSIMKIVTHLSDLADRQRAQSKWKRRNTDKPLLAIVFTKADHCEDCFDDPVEYARRNTSGLWQECCERFPNHRFFASRVVTTAVGRLARGGGYFNVPLRVEPRGVVEPVQWIIDRLRK